MFFEGGKLMISEYMKKYEEDFKRVKEDLSDIKTWYKQIPNLLTIARPIGMVPANILFFTGNIVPAFLLTVGLLSTDFFDGKLARKWNVQSKLGADLDAVGDKIMFLGMALPLVISHPFMLVNLLFEGLIASVNVLGRINGLDTKTVFSGKVKTWFLFLTLGFGYLVEFFNVPVMVLNLLMSSTMIAQSFAFVDYINEYKRMKKEKKILDKIKDVDDTEVLVETLSDEEHQEKVLTQKMELNKVEELRNLRKLVLATQEPNKVYTGKKKVREMIQAKRTIK